MRVGGCRREPPHGDSDARRDRRGGARVLADHGFRERAMAFAAGIRGYDTFGVIEPELEAAAIVAALRLESPVG